MAQDYKNKLVTFLTISILSNACVIHKSEHRKFFEENSHIYVSSSGFTFKILSDEKCKSFSLDLLSERLQIKTKNISNLISLQLPETAEDFCLVESRDPKSSGEKSWICPLQIEHSCWEHIQ